MFKRLISFICDQCKQKKHTECPGGTQCDCQHRDNVVTAG